MSASARRHRFAFLLAGAVTAAAAASDQTAAEETAGDRTGLLPRQQYRPLPGKAVGVLVGGAQALLADEGRRGPADTFCFAAGADSYRWVYVPVEQKPRIGGLRVAVGEKGDKAQRFDSLSLADPQTVKRWGITEPYALVEVEVNGGLGSPAAGSFVATRLRPLDGTADYPFRVAEVIARLRQGYQLWLREQDSAIDEAMAEARRNALTDRKPTGPRERDELLFVTWLPQTQRLRVLVRTRVHESVYRPPVRTPPPTEEGPRTPRKANDRVGTAFGVELGMAYEVSRTGRVEQSEPLPIEWFQKAISSPPVPRRPADSELRTAK
jgi:hypothetical protein